MNEEEQAQQGQVETKENTTVSAFLRSNVEQPENKEVKLERFSVPFEIKPLSAKDLTSIRRKSTRQTYNKKMGQHVKEVDQDLLTDNMIVSSIVVPDLENAEIQQSYGTISDPVGTIQAMLSAGEYSELAEKIQEVSGFDTSLEEDIDEAKK